MSASNNSQASKSPSNLNGHLTAVIILICVVIALVAAVVVEALRQEGLLSVPAGPETVRLLPPLNVSEEEVQQALAIIRRVLKTYVK